MRFRTALVAIAAFSLAGPLAAQERTPPERQSLADLAYALGEAHALRQLCQGSGDQYWREKMMEVSQTEAPDADFEGRLRNAFNNGFAARQNQFTECGPESRRTELAVVRKGQAIAGRLAQSVREVKRMGPDDPENGKTDPEAGESE